MAILAIYPRCPIAILSVVQSPVRDRRITANESLDSQQRRLIIARRKEIEVIKISTSPYISPRIFFVYLSSSISNIVIKSPSSSTTILVGVYATVFRPLAIIRIILHNYLRLPLARTRIKTGVGVCACYLTEWDKRLVVSYRPFDTDMYWLQVYTNVGIVSQSK